MSSCLFLRSPITTTWKGVKMNREGDLFHSRSVKIFGYGEKGGIKKRKMGKPSICHFRSCKFLLTYIPPLIFHWYLRVPFRVFSRILWYSNVEFEQELCLCQMFLVILFLLFFRDLGSLPFRLRSQRCDDPCLHVKSCFFFQNSVCFFILLYLVSFLF